MKNKDVLYYKELSDNDIWNTPYKKKITYIRRELEIPAIVDEKFDYGMPAEYDASFALVDALISLIMRQKATQRKLDLLIRVLLCSSILLFIDVIALLIYFLS